jgi:hypothetical protein
MSDKLESYESLSRFYDLHNQIVVNNFWCSFMNDLILIQSIRSDVFCRLKYGIHRRRFYFFLVIRTKYVSNFLFERFEHMFI